MLRLEALEGKFTLNSHHGTQGWGRPEEVPLPKIESAFFDIFIQVHPENGFIIYYGGKRHYTYKHRFPWADFVETVLHSSTWSIEKHSSCPPAYMSLLTEDDARVAGAAASAPPLSQSLDAFNQQHEQPLPPGWEILVDTSGRRYYGNPSLRITQYQHPGQQLSHLHSSHMLHAQRPPVYQPSQPDAARLSIGSLHIEMQEVGSQLSPRSLWQRCTDAYGRHYVVNTMTGETKWEYGS